MNPQYHNPDDTSAHDEGLAERREKEVMRGDYLRDELKDRMMGNTFAKKPLDQHTTGQGRLTVDLGTKLHKRLISYSKHNKRKIREVTKEALTRYLLLPETRLEKLPQSDQE